MQQKRSILCHPSSQDLTAKYECQEGLRFISSPRCTARIGQRWVRDSIIANLATLAVPDL